MPKPSTPKEARYVSADTTVPGAWQDEVRIQDAVINLAGVSIFQRWNEKTKPFIYDTRILTTRNVVEAMSGGKESLLCSTSAVGYYGFRGDEEITEDESPAAISWLRCASIGKRRPGKLKIKESGWF
jgi:uncharacterized protein